MSTKWSYSGDPSSSQRDAVRFLIGDTVPNDWVFTDAEIDFALANEGSVNEAALSCARAAMARYARVVTSASGDERKDLATRTDQFKKIVTMLEAKRTKRVLGFFAGGISKTDKYTTAVDPDRDAPAFSSNMHDEQNRGGSPSSNIGEV